MMSNYCDVKMWAALTVSGRVKAADKAMTIGEIRLVRKTGGRSGDYRRR